MNFKFFCGSNHLWAYNQFDAFCVMTSRKFLFVWMLNAYVYFRNCCWHKLQPSVSLQSCWWLSSSICWWISSSSGMNFKVFVEAAITELIIMLIPLAWWRYQNKEIFVYLNVDCLCLFGEPEFQAFCGSNHTIYETTIK